MSNNKSNNISKKYIPKLMPNFMPNFMPNPNHRSILSLLLTLSLLLPVTTVHAETPFPPPESLQISAHAGLLMEQSTGTILFSQNAHDPMAPASVTKIMTILLTMEALDQGHVTPDTPITISQNAASMGGSQVYLEQGEIMTLWELLKCVVVVSGNDASVALAEYISGSESAFVEKMNEKAQSLGMTQTTFQNCTGLPAQGHQTTAYDIALMSQALLTNHPEITQLSTIWMDSIRDGAFGLSNTNKLIHSYPGATGLKTGSTDEALYCMSASATRDDLSLIAVILKSPSSDLRFQDASTLLDYGFSTFTLQEIYPEIPLSPIPIALAPTSHLQPQLPKAAKLLLPKSLTTEITTQTNLPESLQAPLEKGQQIGSFDIFLQGNLQKSIPILATEDIPRLSTLEIFTNLFRLLVMAP